MNGDLALFVGPQGRRLTPRSVNRAVRGVAAPNNRLEVKAWPGRHEPVNRDVRTRQTIALATRGNRHRSNLIATALSACTWRTSRTSLKRTLTLAAEHG